MTLWGHLPSKWASSSDVSSNLAQRPSDLKQLNDSVWEFFKPPDRDGISPKAEILFFHGAQLSQDTEAFWKTWLSRDQRVVWPTAWLAQEFPEARMLFISYDSSVRKASSEQKDMYRTIENLMHDVIWSSPCKAGQKCPVIFVGHCFGGILIKQFLIKCCEFVGLRNAEDFRVKEVKRLLQHCKAIFYYSAPNAGSGMVDALNLADKILRNFNQPMVDFLKTLSPNTARINVEFSNLRHDRKWKSVGIGETWKTTLSDGTMTMVVPEASARHDLDHVYWANADHFDVARAINNYSCITYTGLRDMIRDILSSSTSTCCHLKSDPDFKPGLQLFNDERCGMSLRQSNPVYVENTMPSPLPFGRDKKYVPIVSSFQKVQRALESEEGCGVVTLHGEAGLGKTSLAKYIALQYWPHRRPQGSGEASSPAAFSDGVFFLACGQGVERSIKGLQRELLEVLGCPLEAVPVNIPEERDGDFLTIPTLKRRLQFKLRNSRALIILDDVWDRSVIQELILSLDEAISVKYLLTSQITDIWPDAVRIEMERPTLEEARQIVLKYSNGLSTETSFPKNIEGVADTMIETLHFHPLTLAHLGLGFRQGGREPEAWRTVRDSWNHETLIKGFNKPVIYGREYPLTLDASMTRVMHSLEGSAQDLLFLICALKYLRVSEAAVQYLYKCANEGNGSGYRYASNHLENSSLVHIHRYAGFGSELVIHRLRSFSVTSQFPCEVKVLIERALQPLMEMCKHLSAQTTTIATLMRRALQPVRQLYNRQNAQGTLIPIRYFSSAYVNDGLFNAIMVGRFVNKDFLDLTAVEIPRGVDFNLDGLVEAANKKMHWLYVMVKLLYSDANGEGWKQEAAACAKKIVVRFACRDELDDESMGRLIQFPEARGTALQILQTMFEDGYWYTQFLEHKKTFSSGHPQIVKNLFTLLLDYVEMSRMVFAFQHHYPDELGELGEVVGVLFGKMIGRTMFDDYPSYTCDYGMLDYENDDTIVRFGERLIRWALGTGATISSEFLSKQRFPSSPSRAFRVIEKKIPGLWKMMLALHVQEHILPNQKFTILPTKINVPADSLTYSRCHSTTMLDRLCRRIHPRLNLSLQRQGYLVNAKIVEWLSSRKENREKIFECTAIMSSLIGKLVDIAVTEGPKWRWSHYCCFVDTAVCVLLNLALSQKLRLSILSTYPQVVETLERLDQRLESEDTFTYSCVRCVYQALGVFKASSVHIQMSDHEDFVSVMTWRLRDRLRGYYNTEMYEEFLAVTERDVFPTDMKTYFMYHIIVAKALVKRYQSALVDADANVRYSRQHRTSLVGYFDGWDLEADVVTAVAVGLRGMVRLLTRVRENLPEALADFDEAAHLLSTSKLSLKWRGYSPSFPHLPRHATDKYWTARYYMLKQRGYTKHLMEDDVGAREDATEAEQLQDSGLAQDMSSMIGHIGMLRHHDRIFGPTCLLFGRPLTYLGFKFTF